MGSHSQRQAQGASPLLLRRRQFVCEDRDENCVVHAEEDFHGKEGGKGNPTILVLRSNETSRKELSLASAMTLAARGMR